MKRKTTAWIFTAHITNLRIYVSCIPSLVYTQEELTTYKQCMSNYGMHIYSSYHQFVHLCVMHTKLRVITMVSSS